MPKASPDCIFDHQQPAEFLDRDAVGFRPIRRGTRLQSFAAPAWQLLRHPSGHSQSMGATVRLKTGVLHNVIFDEQMKTNPRVLTG
jgi:hypothetical protein